MTKVYDDADEWWVMGTPGRFCGSPVCRYVRWKGDDMTGCYVETSDPEAAERFDTREEAMQEITTSLVQDDLYWGYGEIVPLHVEKRIGVSACLQ